MKDSFLMLQCSWSKVRSVDPDWPLSNIIPKKKETNYLLSKKQVIIGQI